MKNIIKSIVSIQLCVYLLLGIAYGQTIVQGKLKNITDTVLFIRYIDNEGYKNDKIAVKSGVFRWENIASAPIQVSFELSYLPQSDLNSATIWTEPGIVKIELDPDNMSGYKLTGSKTNLLVQTFEKSVIKETEQLQNIFSIAQNKGPESAEMAELTKEYMNLSGQIVKKKLNFLEQNPCSVYSAKLLYDLQSQNLLTNDTVIYYHELLKEEAAKSQYSHFISQKADGKQNGAIGGKAPLFTKKDIKGNDFDLTSLIGKKYILIDFWASWCVPCRQGNPHLKKLYAKYKDKGFEVICIADNDSSEKEWRKSVSDDQIGQFIHVLRGFKGIENIFVSNDLSLRYGVSTLPTKLLIDKKGVIIGRYDQGTEVEKQELDKKLVEIFGE